MSEISEEKSKIIDFRFLIIFGICLFFFWLHIILGLVHYETDDDTTFNMIASGFWGDNRYNLFFINIIYGYFLQILYSLSNNVNWYLIVMLFLNLSAMILLCSSITIRIKNWTIIVLFSVVINVVLGKQLYNELQFTKSATFLLISGFVALVCSYYAESEVMKKYLCISGIIVFLFGFLLRQSSLTLLIPYIIVFLFCHSLCNLNEFKDIKIILNKRFSVPFLILLFLVSLSSIVNYSMTKGQPEWKEYWDYQERRDDLIANGAPVYETFENMYNEVGWHEAELSLFISWISVDDSFSSEKLKFISDFKNSNLAFKRYLSKDYYTDEFFNDYYELILKRSMSNIEYGLVYLILMFILLLTAKKTGILNLFMSLGVFALECAYLVYIYRVTWRVFSSLLMSLILINVLFAVLNYNSDNRIITKLTEYCQTKNISYSRLERIFIVSLMLFFFVEKLLVLSAEFIDDKEGQVFFRRSTNSTDFIDLTREDNNTYYVDTLTFSEKFKSVWDIKEDSLNMNKKYVGVGGWMIPSPTWKQYYGDEIPQLTDLYTKQNVYFVTSSETVFAILRFLGDKYDDRITVELVYEYKDIKVWKYYISQEE